MHAKTLVTSLIAGLGFAATVAHAGSGASAADAAGKSRAEVRADLVLWQRSGMAQLSALESYDPTSPQAQERMATYRQLRSGPEYLAEVQRQGGSVERTAAAGSGISVR